jgi:hypothetical protein
MKTPEQKYAELGAWLVKGSDGWLAMLEKLTAEGHTLDGLALGQLKTAAARLQAVVAAQEQIAGADS